MRRRPLTGATDGQVFYSPVKLQGSLYSGNFLSIDAVVNFETFLAAVISEADAVLVDATCVNEVFVLRENSTFVILLSSVTSESQAAWDHVLQPLQLWFTFNIFKGTFVTQWQGQRLVFVAAYSPLYRVAQAAVRPAPQQAQAQQALIRGAASASAAVEALGSVPHVAVNKADDTRTAFGQCAAAFSRAGLNPREEFTTALSHGGSQLARRPVLALTGTNTSIALFSLVARVRTSTVSEIAIGRTFTLTVYLARPRCSIVCSSVCKASPRWVVTKIVACCCRSGTEVSAPCILLRRRLPHASERVHSGGRGASLRSRCWADGSHAGRGSEGLRRGTWRLQRGHQHQPWRGPWVFH